MKSPREVVLPSDQEIDEVLAREPFKPGELTDEQFLDEATYLEDLAMHFEAFGARDGVTIFDVADEGRRVLNLFAVEIEKESPIDYILGGISSGAAEVTCQEIAKVLGVDPKFVTGLTEGSVSAEVFRRALSGITP